MGRFFPPVHAAGELRPQPQVRRRPDDRRGNRGRGRSGDAAFFPDAANAFPRLALATLVTCLASTLFPTTNYSIVVAASLALEPSAGVAGAVSRAEAIALGAAIGIGVSLSVWPQLSRSCAFEIMGELLDDGRALLATMPILGPLENCERVDALHESFLRHLVEACAVCGETRVRACFETGSSLGAALLAFETLWHGLVLLDRIGQSQCGWLTEKEREPLAECIDLVRECASGYLQALATWMRSCRLPNALSGR
ncbi:hypothetical protein [Caballeronia sp. PC1]|uniref:hypothetical protein n=1 Tax=Caballeronia sp. PC1 TaxID=2906765 RepID=UPI001F22DBDB|nr:hypothetical protein [Caballeronia sp. PC1]MCE4543912.1 hypothetical protein [Caballeronia sp. PC1]